MHDGGGVSLQTNYIARLDGIDDMSRHVTTCRPILGAKLCNPGLINLPTSPTWQSFRLPPKTVASVVRDTHSSTNSILAVNHYLRKWSMRTHFGKNENKFSHLSNSFTLLTWGNQYMLFTLIEINTQQLKMKTDDFSNCSKMTHESCAQCRMEAPNVIPMNSDMPTGPDMCEGVDLCWNSSSLDKRRNEEHGSSS